MAKKKTKKVVKSQAYLHGLKQGRADAYDPRVDKAYFYKRGDVYFTFDGRATKTDAYVKGYVDGFKR